MSEPELDSAQSTSAFHRRARWILTSFLFTFMAARITVFLIASRRIPDTYLYFGGTHVHHLNYGILLLSGVGAYLLLGNPREKRTVVGNHTLRHFVSYKRESALAGFLPRLSAAIGRFSMLGHDGPKLGQGCPHESCGQSHAFTVHSKLFKIEVMVTIRTYTLRTARAPRFVALVRQLRTRCCGCPLGAL